MAKEETFEINGTVTEKLQGRKFKVTLENGHEITAYLSGKMAMNYIKISVGDSVTVAMGPYDVHNGRIIWRSR